MSLASQDGGSGADQAVHRKAWLSPTLATTIRGYFSSGLVSGPGRRETCARYP